MKVKGLVSFTSSTLSLYKGQIMDVSNNANIQDLTKCGLVEVIEKSEVAPVQQKKKKVATKKAGGNHENKSANK